MESEARGFLDRRRPEEVIDPSSATLTEVNVTPINVRPLLHSYWEILLRRRWQIGTSAVIVITIVAIYSFKTKPVYQATGRVVIEAETPQIQSLADIYRSLPDTDQTFLKTQVEVLESDSLAWGTVEQLDLGRRTEFAPWNKRGTQPVSASVEREGALIQNFRRHLTVTLAPDSRIAEVSFESADPHLAAQVVNALLNNYLEYNFHEKYDATRQASGWMKEQLDELKAKVESSQEALVNYERKNAIVNVSDRQNVAEERLEELSKDLTAAQSDLAQKQSVYDLARTNERQVALIAQNGLLERLQEKIADLKSQYVEALAQFGPNFPKVVRLRDQVAEMQSLIGQEQKRTVDRIQNDYEAAVGREKLLADSVAMQKAEVGRLNQLLIQHNLLKREFDTNQQLYDSLLQRLKEATVSAGLRATNIHILDRALVPTIPVRPRKLRNILMSVFVGLFVGFALALLQENLDSSVKNAEEAERATGIACLAAIPAAEEDRSRRRSQRRQLPQSARRDSPVALTVMNDPSSYLAESYRTLRTAVLLSMPARPPQTVLVTSAQPDEGKTCTSVNLSVALAQRGKRVLLIDSDLRKPGIAAVLGLSNEEGLSGVLTGAYGLCHVLREVEQTPGLWILPAGPHTPNPAELVSSPGMEAVIKEARQQFDHVILDSPPLLMVTDATVLSLFVDGTILVAACGRTAKGALVRAQRVLRVAGGTLLGLVLNKVDYRHDVYYSGFYYYNYSDGKGSSDGQQDQPTNGHHSFSSSAPRTL